jgi:hypothetical protein
VIDRLLGAVVVDVDTGRKVVEADVESWQFAKVKRATIKQAAALYVARDGAGGVPLAGVYASVSGPDFSFSGMVGLPVEQGGPAAGVLDLLDQSGLRVLTTNIAGRGRGYPPWFSFAYNVEND